MKLNLMSIGNVERFFEIVEKCQGAVMLHLADCSLCDLKKNPLARQLLEPGTKKQNPMSLQLSCPADFPLLLQYMMEAAYE